MELPNYYFADLGSEEALTPDLVRDAALTLKRNREKYLDPVPSARLIRTIGGLAESWMDPEFHFRRHVLEAGPEKTGFSRGVLERGLDAFFSQLTRDHLELLVAQELGHMKRLDGMSISREERFLDRASVATGPQLAVHITAGNLPVPAMSSMVFGLLAGAAQFVKCPTGASFLPRLFAHSLYEIEPKLGACLEIAEWKGGNEGFEQALFEQASCVTATGSDETLKSIRDRLPLHVRFIGHGHRVSFGYIGREVLEGFQARETLANAARDVAAWDQLGCLSPHVFYVENDGPVKPVKFAEQLAEELDRLEEKEPRGNLDDAAAADIVQRRGVYEIRAAHSPDTRHWFSKDSTAWTVIYEADPVWQYSCLNRFVYVKAVTDLNEMLRVAEPIRHLVSTIGVAVPEERLEETAMRLARWGATRICPVGRMQQPPLSWRHDGRLPLAELVTWTDWEQ